MSTAVADTEPAVVSPPPARRPRVEPLAELLVGLEPGGWFEVAGVTWAEYRRLMAVRDEHRPGVRLLFDRGRLEVMSPGTRHERWRKLLGLLVELYLTEADVPYMPCGNMTYEREDLAKGFEPDECYYLRPTADLLAVRQIDFHTDPPPDLIIEVEASRSATGRLPVYATFRIPEVWRFDGRAVTVLRLQPDGSYQPAPSQAAPGFPLAEVPRYLQMLGTVDHGRIIRDFQAFVRTLAPPTPPETA